MYMYTCVPVPGPSLGLGGWPGEDLVTPVLHPASIPLPWPRLLHLWLGTSEGHLKVAPLAYLVIYDTCAGWSSYLAVLSKTGTSV